MTADRILKETGTAPTANAPVKSTSSSPSASSPSSKKSPPSTISVASTSEKAISSEAQETATSKAAMSTGYYEGTMPDQNAGNSQGNEYVNSGNSNGAAAPATDPAIGGGSVVNDLMKVYEDMTKSSTPQVPPAAAQKYHIPPPMFSVPPNANQPLHNSNNQQQQHFAGQQQYEQSRQASSAKRDDSLPPSIPSSIQMSRSQESTTLLHNDESDDHSSSKRKRRGSCSSNSVTKTKKKSKQDGRWSKRFTWPEDLHRDFVSAIFDVGLKQSSPSTILEQMPKHEQITTERIKSHLQKYRLHRSKSKKEFISTYEASLRKMQAQGGVNGTNTMSGGEVAAHLTYTESADSNNGGKPTSPAPSTMGSSSMSPGPMKGVHMSARPAAPIMTSGQTGLYPSPEETDTLMLPELTEAEKQSPIGSAMGYLMGLYFSLRQQLMIQRSVENGQGGAAPMQATVGATSHMQDMYAPTAVSATAPAPPMATPDLHSDGMSHQQAIPSMRTNIEENSIMKREMQNQMALQNKMRALKQQELAKYKNNDHGDYAHAYHGVEHDAYASKNAGPHMAPDPRMSHGQGAGEMEVSDGVTNQHRAHGLSFGTSADLWNTDVVDDQLFEFLMNGD